MVAHFSSRLPEDYTPNRLARGVEERRRSGARLLDLTESNPTRVGLPAPVADDWRALLEGAAQPYEPHPLGSPAGRQAVSGYYADLGVELSPERVVLVASTSEAYAHLFRILCDPGHEILVPEPSYPLFAPLAALEAVRPVPYFLRYGDSAWHIDLDSAASGVGPRTRALVVVHPNNPTGSLTSLAEADALDGLCARRGLALIADEVFGDFVFSPPSGRADRRGSFASGSAGLRFVLSGLSKVCGLPQAKLAWIAIAGPEDEMARARERLEWVADAFLSVSPATQHALPALLARRHEFQRAARQRLAQNLACADRGVAALKGVERLALDGGWSMILRLPPTRTEDEWVERLLERDVLVHPGYFFDIPNGPHLVLGLLPRPEEFAAGFDALGALLSSPG